MYMYYACIPTIKALCRLFELDIGLQAECVTTASLLHQVIYGPFVSYPLDCGDRVLVGANLADDSTVDSLPLMLCEEEDRRLCR